MPAVSPLVSVIMACYNEAQRLEGAVESILSQSFVDFEFIIIDDGSTDGTTRLIESYKSRDPRIVFLKNSVNSGLGSSLNKGIKGSRGRYIARMDADDISHPNRLERQVSFLNNHPDIDVLGTAIYKIDRESGASMGVGRLPTSHDEIVAKVFIKPLVYHPTIMAKKTVYEQNGYYDENVTWGEDADLWYRIYDRITFHNLEDPLLTYSTKSRLSTKILYHNLKNKCHHLHKRQLLVKHLHVLMKDLLVGSFRMIKNY